MLKRVAAVLGIGVLGALVANAQPASGQQVIVKRGTVLAVTMLQPLSSKTARRGDDVPLRLSRPLVVNGVTLLREGEILHGKVTQVDRAGPKNRDGQVRWKLERLRFADKRTAELRFVGPWRDGPPPERISLGNDRAVFGRFVVREIAGPFYVSGFVVPTFQPTPAPDQRRAGTEYLLPANSTILVVVMDDHQVHI